MRSGPLDKRVFDRVALLLSAIVAFGGVLGLVLFGENYFGLHEDWVRLLLAGLAVTGLVTYFGATLPGPRAYRRRQLFWPLLLLTAVAPVGLCVMLIRAGIVPMPQRVYPYTIISLFLIPALITAFHWLLRALYHRRR